MQRLQDEEEGPQGKAPTPQFGQSPMGSCNSQLYAAPLPPVMDILPNDSFSIVSDATSSFGSRFLALIFLCGAAGCFVVASLGNQKGSGATTFFCMCLGALVLVIFSLMFGLRVGAPTAIDIARVNGAWSLVLQRRALGNVVRCLDDLEGFVETFAYCFRLSTPCSIKRVGHTTSKAGTVRFFFAESSAGPALAMSGSLQEPLAFFVKLRDVMLATSHNLTGITMEYVADWGRSDTTRDEAHE